MDIPQAAPQIICPQCHLPSPATAYFCYNCGKNLREPELSTSVGTQIWIYAFSAFLPVICYLAISKWPAFKYVKSADPKARLIGFVAIAILIISTIITFWLTASWLENAVNSELNGAGGLGGANSLSF